MYFGSTMTRSERASVPQPTVLGNTGDELKAMTTTIVLVRSRYLERCPSYCLDKDSRSPKLGSFNSSFAPNYLDVEAMDFSNSLRFSILASSSSSTN